MTAGEEIIYDLKRQIWEAGQIGKNEGINEGINEEKERIAKSMKEDGVMINLITQYTGLTLDQIEKL